MCSAKNAGGARRPPVAGLTLSLGLLLGLAIPTSLDAQAGERLDGQTVDDLVQRLDSLAPLLEQAERAAEQADREARRRAREELGLTLDTLRVGPLRIVTPEGQASDARRAFEEVWEDAGPRVGDATDELSETIWTFQYAPRLHGLHVFFTQHGERRQRVHVRSWLPWDRVLRAAEKKVWSVLGRQLEGEVEEVISSAWGPWWPLTPERLEAAHRELVAAPGRPARACVAGDVDACWVAIGADGVPDGWEEWYEPAERRAVVRTRFREEAPWAAVEACERGVQDACDDLLNESADPALPLNGAFRTRIVAHAVQLGGEGGYERLVKTGGADLREALSRAAEMDANEVMESWRTRVLENRPEVGGDTARRHWSTLVWMVVFGILAMGSTRWRVG